MSFSRFFYILGRGIRETGQALDRIGSRIQGDYAFTEQLSRHRRLMNLFDLKPQISNDVFIAPNAAVIGNVRIGKGSTVWYGSVLRGDVNSIEVGQGSSIGDNCVVHVTSAAAGKPSPTIVGNEVTVEQGTILHGCTLQDKCKVGSGSVIFDGVVVESNAVIAPGSLVTSNKRIPAGELWGGSPATFIRQLTPEEQADVSTSANTQYNLAKKHEEEHRKNGLRLQEDADYKAYHSPPRRIETF